MYESNETKIKFILFLKERRELNGREWTPYVDGSIQADLKKLHYFERKDTHKRHLEIVHYPPNYNPYERLN